MTPASSPQPVSNGPPVGAPVPRARTVLCPYCGHISLNTSRCEHCKGLFDPLSKQASQNAMGPWFIRDAANPFRPGCSYETLRLLIDRGKITPSTVLRGPSTRQFWMHARSVPGVANLLGECHACHRSVRPGASSCDACGSMFVATPDREFLGLAPVHLLPGMAAPETIAQAAASPVSQRPNVEALRSALPSDELATGFSPASWATPAGSGAGVGGEAIDAVTRELTVSRLERRSRSLVTWLWVIAVLLVLSLAACLLSIFGPELGIDVLHRDAGPRVEPAAGTGASSGRKAAPAIPAGPTSTGGADATPGPAAPSSPVPPHGTPPKPPVDPPGTSGPGAEKHAGQANIGQAETRSASEAYWRALQAASAVRTGL